MTYILGLTGGIASGKSTASQILREFGAQILDADLITHELQQPYQAGWKQIYQVFGKEYFEGDELNRKKLGNLVFNDNEALAKLNQIMHPLIRTEIKHRIEKLKTKHTKLIVIDMALLFEDHYENQCTSTMVIDVLPECQIRRLMSRNQLTRAQAQARISVQMERTKRNQKADDVIENNGSVDDLKQKMLKWLSSKDLI